MREIKAREERQQMFMNHMADTVIKEMDAKAHEEDLKIKRYEQNKELSERREEERRLRRFRENNQKTKEFLFKQMEERKKQEKIEKEHNDEQAKIWEVDRVHALQEEKRVAEKYKKINNDTAYFLKQQMNERVGGRTIRTHMNRNEFLYNKEILVSVNNKLREHESHYSNMPMSARNMTPEKLNE